MKENRNQPIFPTEDKDYFDPSSTQPNTFYTGLTKREYFAAKALQGILTDENVHLQSAANMAVEAADALLTELEKTNSDEN